MDKSELYDSHAKLIYYVARKLANRDHTKTNDYISIGNYVFMKAVDKYNPAIGIKFGSFLCRCIKNAVINYEKNNSVYISIPENFDMPEFIENTDSDDIVYQDYKDIIKNVMCLDPEQKKQIYTTTRGHRTYSNGVIWKFIKEKYPDTKQKHFNYMMFKLRKLNKCRKQSKDS